VLAAIARSAVTNPWLPVLRHRGDDCWQVSGSIARSTNFDEHRRTSSNIVEHRREVQPINLCGEVWLARTGFRGVLAISLRALSARWPDPRPSSLIAMLRHVGKTKSITAHTLMTSSHHCARPARRLPLVRAAVESVALR
jgi:hypothetical protein